MSDVVSLAKGDRVNLNKVAPRLKIAAVGLGWHAQQFDSFAFDLDASAFLLDANGKILDGDSGNFIFYGNLEHSSGSVRSLGDNVTGSGSGDDETIIIEFPKVPAAVAKIQVAITIYEAELRNHQNFGQVHNAYCRVYDHETGAEIARYDLSEDYSGKTALVVGEFYLKDGDWRFAAIGGGYNGGLEALCKGVGLAVR